MPHAFGGALALAFHVEEPRATRDIDVNLFVPADHARSALAALPRAVAWTDEHVSEVGRVGQVRVFWDDTPVDCFFSTHRFHEAAQWRTEIVPFAGVEMPVLRGEDLAVLKAYFDRTRDWADIEAMSDAGAVDVHEVLGWLVELLGPDDARVARMRSLLSRRRPPGQPRFAPDHFRGRVAVTVAARARAPRPPARRR